MTTQNDIAVRFARNAGTDGRMLHNSASNVYVSRDGRTIYSYGSHFPMAEIMPADDGSARGWWLVNGDSYSVSTTRHQSLVRGALQATGLPMLIVPFSALQSANVARDSVRITDVLPDRYETITHTVAALADVPDNYFWYDVREPWQDDAGWHYQTREHHLGESVFTGEVTEHHASRDARGNADPYGWTTSKRRASFLSGFDTQEGFGLYFMAELPGHAETVAEAYEMLRPAEVQAADAMGLHVTRQGDVFAVPSTYATRELASPERMVPVAGVNHIVTERRLDALGREYGRGFMRHRPLTTWGTPRRAEHRVQRMGDGKTWHLMLRNTVPAGRSWSVQGNVD